MSEPITNSDSGSEARLSRFTFAGETLSTRLVIAGPLLAILFSGCVTHGNHYMAEDLPRNSRLRVVSRASTKEVDLSKLASSSGSSQLIGAGDRLEVTITAGLSADSQTTIPVTISDDGLGSLPHLGRIKLAGLEPNVAELVIRDEYVKTGQYRDPHIAVGIAQPRLNQIRVIGAVREPQVVKLSPNSSDIVTAIAEAGGLADNAGSIVEIRNPRAAVMRHHPSVTGKPYNPYLPVSATTNDSVEGTMVSYSVDLHQAAQSGTDEFLIADGGVINVETRDPAPIAVEGLVNKPDRYEFPIGQDLRVLDAIAMAGGLKSQVADKVYVIRHIDNSQDPIVLQLSLRKAKHSGDSNILLGPGDVVYVEQTPATVLLEAFQIIRFGVSSSLGTFF